MAFIKLDSHWVNQVPGGVRVDAVSLTTQLPSGVMVQMAAPFLPLGNDLAIMPLFEGDGENAVRIRLDRWIPLRLNPVHRFPLNFDSQDGAVRIARAFDADPDTRWDCTEDEAMSWFQAWRQANTATTNH